MTQQELLRQVLDRLDSTPETPANGDYLTQTEAEAIVDQTIHLVQQIGNAIEHRYIVGHRRRLSVTLTMIPRAEKPDATFLDVGCYGYMAYWAQRHLGYSHVEGVEWLPDVKESVVRREVALDGAPLSFRVHNFDISQAAWPLHAQFDTVLLLETLEHVNHDPQGVLTNVVARMRETGTLVASVPNSVSYKTLEEFMMGAPPWTYWFYHPDLGHEPRHAFEPTPIFFKAMLRSAGLREEAFQTICAYADRLSLDPIFAVGEALSVEPRFFGDTMIAQATKLRAAETIRFPDLIYNGDAYYETSYPLLVPRLDRAMANFQSTWGALAEMGPLRTRLQAAEVEAAEALRLGSAHEKVSIENSKLANDIRAMERQNRELRTQTAEALALCSGYLEVQSEKAALLLEVEALQRRNQELQAQAADALALCGGNPQVLLGNQALLDDLKVMEETNHELRAQVAEALALCCGYLQVLSDTSPSVRESWVQRHLFRQDGRPVKALRRLLFHTSGKPRSTFRRIVFKKNGQPRDSFKRWLTSDAYRHLPRAVRLPLR